MHQQGNPEKASLIYLEILETIADSPLVNYNLGLALFEMGHYSESCNYYRKALEFAPDEIDILYNLALCYKRLNKYEESIAAYKKVLSLNPHDVESLYNLACCYTDIHSDENAISYYKKVLEYDSTNESAINNLAFVYHRNEDFNKAEIYYSKLLKLDPAHHAAKHMLDSLHGVSNTTTPLQYIQEIFDNYSSRYDISLVEELEYGVPKAMRLIYNKKFNTQSSKHALLDLGCGTGLSGEAFADICTVMTGVDLSPKMIKVAAEKNIYTTLCIDEIQHFLKTCDEKYSLILAADTFGYVGMLENTFKAAHDVAMPSAIFCFSTEWAADEDLVLQKSGRFAHSSGYINDICDKTGWKITERISTNLRKDKERWVKGMLYLALK